MMRSSHCQLPLLVIIRLLWRVSPRPTTSYPTQKPTSKPTKNSGIYHVKIRCASDEPTRFPTQLPTEVATTMKPTASPTQKPTSKPTSRPTLKPTPKPSTSPPYRPLLVLLLDPPHHILHKNQPQSQPQDQR
eukprot:327228_1